MTDDQVPEYPDSDAKSRRARIRLIAAGAAAVLVLIFVIQNHTRVRMHYLGADFSAPLWLMLLIVLAVGVLIGFLVSWRRHRRD